MAATIRSRLWNRDFAILWAGLAQSYLGDAFLAVGLMWLALEMTGSPAVAGTIMALEGLPKLFGPLAGAIVDRSNLRRLLIGSDLARGALLVAIFGLHSTGRLEIWHLYGLVVALGAFEIFYGPSLQVMLPTLVPDTALPAATGLLQATLQVSLIVGASLAGALLAVFGTPLAILLDGITFILAAAALSFVRFPSSLLRKVKLGVRQLASDLIEGFRFILGSTEVLSLTGIALLINLVLSPANVIFPIFSRDVLRGGVQGYGLLAASIAGGLLLGNALAGLVGDRVRHTRLMLLGMAGMAAALAVLSLVRTMTPALAATVALGMTAPFIQVPLVTRLQRIVPQRVKGRVFATLQSLLKLALPVAAAAAGQALTAFPVAVVLRGAAMGVAVAVTVWAAAAISVRHRPMSPVPEEAPRSD